MDIKVRNQLLIAHFYCQNFYILLKIAQKSLGSMWIVLVIIVEYYNITSWEKGFPLYFTTLENAQFQSFVSKYQQSFALEYRGDNTTGVCIKPFISQDSGVREINIYPSDTFWTRGLVKEKLTEGCKITIGVEVDSPEIWGEIRNFHLCRK